MTKPSVNILVNTSANDVVCSNPAGDDNYLLVSSSDAITWRDTEQTHNDPITGTSYPVIIPTSGYQEAPKTFLKDDSAGALVQIPMAGTSDGQQLGGNNRYVFAAFFTEPTTTIPYLRAYNNSSAVEYDHRLLGNGIASNSVFKAVATKNAAPGSAVWAGTPLAGADSQLALDTSYLSTSGYVYWNMKMVIPYTAAAWSSASWNNSSIVFVIHFTYS